MGYNNRLAELKEAITNIEYVKYTLNSLIYWDKVTYMPPEGIEYRSKVMGYFADQQYKMLSDKKFVSNVEFFQGHKKNDKQTDVMIKRIQRSVAYINKIPEEEYKEYIKRIAISEQVWDKARREGSYQQYKPYLEKIFNAFKSFAGYWGYEQDPYDALLGYNEEGLNVREMDVVVEQIKEHLIPMVDAAQEKAIDITPDMIIAGVQIDRQMKLWELILEKVGFDFNAGRVDVGSHPTILANSPSDVRIVNTYQVEDLRTGIFNVLHSCGKGIYQQSIDKNLLGTFLAEAPSFALEESIGRFFENIIGRSRSFWQWIFPEVVEIIPEMKEIGLENFFKSINDYRPSLIRLDADELTYLLHIIIRYEVEKDIINDRLPFDQVERVWSEKYKAYLGVSPSKDSEGILQDIHWAAGYFGYFPMYFISNLAAAQFANAIEKEEDKISELIAAGEFSRVVEWLKKNIFHHGAVYNFSEILLNKTGEPLNPNHYISYLRNKMSEVYTTNTI